MSTDFSQLIADIEQEARDEGPQAVRELEQFREEFSSASQLIESRGERSRTAKRTDAEPKASRRRKPAAGKTVAGASQTRH
jgi:hypothetical protein